MFLTAMLGANPSLQVLLVTMFPVPSDVHACLVRQRRAPEQTVGVIEIDAGIVGLLPNGEGDDAGLARNRAALLICFEDPIILIVISILNEQDFETYTTFV